MPSADLPLNSLFLVGAVNPFIKDRDYELDDIYILSNLKTYPDQLKYISEIKDDQHITIKHCMSYVLIDKPETYWRFMNAFFDDYSLDKGIIPEKLDNEFMCYLSRDDAQQMAEELQKKQNSYYDGLIEAGKSKVENLKIIAFDLPELLGKYNMSDALMDMVNGGEKNN